MGIWKDVRLVAYEGVSLANPIVLPQLDPPYDRATLRIRLNVNADQPRSMELSYRVRCLTLADQPVIASQKTELVAGANQADFSMEIAKPRLWWPNGYGKQHLYELEVTAQAVGEAKVLAVVRTTFGIRDLKMLANPVAPENVEYVDYATGEPVTHRLSQPEPEQRYLIQINGRRIFARGSNWVPCDLLFGRPREPFYEHLIRLAAEANFNLFRIWGGGLIDKPIFYELCDRYGIMLFQEFPNAGTRLDETDAALAITNREAREILPLLMNHPCIVRYGGGNEWYIDAESSRQMAQLRAICNEVDPTRPYHDPDPETKAQRHGLYWYERPQLYELYNAGRPLLSGPVNPLEWNEFGCAGASSVETLKSIMPSENLWPVRNTDPYWNWHKAFNAYLADNWLGPSNIFGSSVICPT
jgi:beta-mannosidase